MTWNRPLLRAGIAGLVAGFVAGGILGRAWMRLVAILEGQSTAFSAEGTFTVLASGTIAGLVFGLAYVPLRARLQWAGRLRGLAFGGLLFGLILALLIVPAVEAGLSPSRLLLLANLGLIPVAYGALLEATIELLESRFARAVPAPAPSSNPP